MKMQIRNTMAVSRFKDGGWTEAYIIETNNPDIAASVASCQFLNNILMQQRMLFGGFATVWTATTFTALETPGARPQLIQNNPAVTGPGSNHTDASFTSMELIGTTSLGKRRLFRFAGVADEYVVNGQLALSGLAAPALTNVINVLKGSYIHGVDNSQVQVPIITVSTAGLVTTFGNHGLAPGDAAQLMRVRTTTNGKASGVYLVNTAPTSNTFTVANWNAANTVDGVGTVRKYVQSFQPITIVAFNRIVARKVGRIFGEPRARR